MSGWFAVSRGITSHYLFKGNPARLAVWMWLLDNVAWKDTTHDVNGATVSVPRGSVCASERHIAKECGVGYQVVRTAIKRFKAEHMVNATSTHGKNLITLLNYEKYQNPNGQQNAAPNAPPTHGQRSANAQKEQGNNIQKKDISPNGDMPPSDIIPISKQKRRKPELPLPEGWVPDIDKARRIMAEHDLTREEMNLCYQSMEAHAHANDKRQRDWDAAYRNWCLSEIKYGNIGPKSRARKQSGGSAQPSIWD